ncbi:DUF4328 domain-containing protein [Yinghuangia soli]|uniref:DUF4328 domain-containing protein n=1 Tax=Yinghuangia soli TaxID=2908204 RepID=A0AA41Q5Z2_9ACTN|nr:DUF4328 domain-containing protein [Yinghuangia soli]MCF2531590.1 DUF4328 domain-containing protein [Yinghuangia soli]
MPCANCGAPLTSAGLCPACGAAPTQAAHDPYAAGPGGAVPPPPGPGAGAPGSAPGHPGAAPGFPGQAPGFAQPGAPGMMPPAPAMPGGTGWGGGYGMAPQWSPFQSIQGLGTALMILFGVAAGTGVLSTVAYFRRASVLDDISEGRLWDSDPEGADDLVQAALGFTGVAMLAVAVLMIIWLYRARANTDGWAAPPATMSSKGWAIGGWFIPVANWVIPAIVVNDTWKRSDVRASVPGGRPGGRGLLWAWWVCYVLATLLYSVSAITRKSEDDVNDGDVTFSEYVDAGKAADNTAGVSSLLLIAAAILGIFVVRKIVALQNERVGLGGGAPGYGGPGFGGPVPAGYGAPQGGAPYPGAPYPPAPGAYPGGTAAPANPWGSGPQPPQAPPSGGIDFGKH